MLGHCLYTLGFMFPLTDVKVIKIQDSNFPLESWNAVRLNSADVWLKVVAKSTDEMFDGCFFQ